MPYLCQQCRINNDSIQCRGCYQFLVSDTAAIDAFLPAPPLPDGPIDTAVCVAHWGDTFHALSHTKQVLDAIGQPSCDVLYWGPDRTLKEWIGAQPWVSKVYDCPVDENYKAFAFNAQNRIDKQACIHLLPDFDGRRPDQVFYVDGIANYFHNLQYSIKPLANLVMPDHRIKAAQKILRNAAGKETSDLVLLHPSSTLSASEAMHWQHWGEAIEWILAHTKDTRFLVTGLNDGKLPDDERLIDLRKKLPSNMENLALIPLVGRTFTTCNSVSIWAVAQGIPSLIIGNKAITSHVNPFRRLFDRNPGIFVPVDANFDDFIAKASDFFGVKQCR